MHRWLCATLCRTTNVGMSYSISTLANVIVNVAIDVVDRFKLSVYVSQCSKPIEYHTALLLLTAAEGNLFFRRWLQPSDPPSLC